MNTQRSDALPSGIFPFSPTHFLFLGEKKWMHQRQTPTMAAPQEESADTNGPVMNKAEQSTDERSPLAATGSSVNHWAHVTSADFNFSEKEPLRPTCSSWHRSGQFFPPKKNFQKKVFGVAAIHL
jgi:hypothetical protein